VTAFSARWTASARVLPGGRARQRLYGHGGISRPPSSRGGTVRSNVVAIFMLFGGVFFTVFAVAAWKTGRRVGAMFLAVLAGIDIALAIEFLSRFYKS
jgi:hypothetical protein